MNAFSFNEVAVFEIRTVIRVARSFALAAWVLLPARLAAAEAVPFEFRRNVSVPMSDGTSLAANVFLPRSAGPFPVILVRSPYGKPNETWGEAGKLTGRGYAVVFQDCRGRGDSKGEWDPFRYDPQDGFETQEWVGRQEWCNGRIGTSGGSYGGWTQWSSASRGSRYLRAMVPVVPFADVYRDIAYPGGAFQLSLLFGWGASVGGIKVDPARFNEHMKFLPLTRWDEQFEKRAGYLRDWIEHPVEDAYWRARSIEGRYDLVTVPTLNIGGWYDIFSKATLDQIARVRSTSTNRLARNNQCVVMGPWGHGVGGRKVGELDFGEAAKLDISELQAKWLDYWLQDRETGVERWAPYRIFVMGENVWRDEHEWPLARTRWTPWYFHSGGGARTVRGNGTLRPDLPGADEPSDTFTYDPGNPVPTRGGNNLVGPPTGPFDQSEVEMREDVLVYTSAPLPTPVEVTGPVRVFLHATTSAKDTDFTAKLVDVHPDGKAYLICDGIRRARYRTPELPPSLVEPGRPYLYEIDLWVTSNVFKAGHRLRVEISSSNFPRFDRNPNTGAPFGSGTELVHAQQTVHHDVLRPSHIFLPVIPR